MTNNLRIDCERRSICGKSCAVRTSFEDCLRTYFVSLIIQVGHGKERGDFPTIFVIKETNNSFQITDLCKVLLMS